LIEVKEKAIVEALVSQIFEISYMPRRLFGKEL
jgi:hypothetical protein